MPRFATGILFAALGVTRLAGHDYWIEPGRLAGAPGDTVPLRVFVGEKLKAEEERPYEAGRTVRWEALSAAGRQDLREGAADGVTPAGQLRLAGPGTHLVVLERLPALITIAADRFTDYLREEGLGAIIAARAKNGESGKPGRERYQRFLKSYVRADGGPEAVVPAATLRLDLAPGFRKDRGPRVGDRVWVRVTFDGQPLARTTIFAEARLPDGGISRGVATDADGWAEIELNAPGLWVVRLVHMRRAPAGDRQADWESFWGACSFGVAENPAS